MLSQLFLVAVILTVCNLASGEECLVGVSNCEGIKTRTLTNNVTRCCKTSGAISVHSSKIDGEDKLTCECGSPEDFPLLGANGQQKFNKDFGKLVNDFVKDDEWKADMNKTLDLLTGVED